MKQPKRRILPALFAVSALLALLAGCAAKPAPISASEPVSVYSEAVELDLADFEAEMVPLAEMPAALSTSLVPVASGEVVYSQNSASIDASHTGDGYVMACYSGSDTSKRIKVLVAGPSGVSYNYNLNPYGEYETFPFSDGSGDYKVSVCQNTTGSKYAVLLSKTISVQLSDEFAPFLRPNQYVNFTPDSAVVAKAKELTAGCGSMIDKVSIVYDFVVTNFSYDREKAQTVQSGYLPVVDEILESKTGICFDYAAVMAAMLRSQNVPTKLVIGYAGEVYHAWISTYSEESGWVDGVIFFDGSAWKLMDPTFASTANSSPEVLEYIGNGSNYSQKYLY